MKLTWTRRRESPPRWDGTGTLDGYWVEASIRDNGRGLWTSVSVRRDLRLVSTDARLCASLPAAKREAGEMIEEIVGRNREKADA